MEVFFWNLHDHDHHESPRQPPWNFRPLLLPRSSKRLEDNHLAQEKCHAGKKQKTTMSSALLSEDEEPPPPVSTIRRPREWLPGINEEPVMPSTPATQLSASESERTPRTKPAMPARYNY
jgi:hypothetical protein